MCVCAWKGSKHFDTLIQSSILLIMLGTINYPNFSNEETGTKRLSDSRRVTQLRDAAGAPTPLVWCRSLHLKYSGDVDLGSDSGRCLWPGGSPAHRRREDKVLLDWPKVRSRQKEAPSGAHVTLRKLLGPFSFIFSLV